ncbi:hypothetical protein P872_07320 [Rhodonellum psychrophilum GCM71 = DSM 17998]|uniref:Uncharacterized protein n=1 Tax=Rhodonellum psychrophilum GCM71 = DSM 17998 TaxID=1123057 RepID=U5BXB6_9BACT|nr:hypothetical protein P872_07320 [Rhodonellum psychrophilum GCM71 = DSM 17998]
MIFRNKRAELKSKLSKRTGKQKESKYIDTNWQRIDDFENIPS